MQLHKPLVQRNLAALKHRADRNRVLLAAIVALNQASAVRFALKALGRERTAMRAIRTLRPALRLKVFAGIVSVDEAGSGAVQN